jgi:2-dehydropantoate 2-reductase
VGSLMTAALIDAGRSVCVVARGKRLEQVRQQGIVVRSDRPFPEHMTVDAYAVDDVTQASVLVLCMKIRDLRDAQTELLDLLRRCGPDVAVVGIQNGVEVEEFLAELLASSKLPNPVLGGIAFVGSRLVDGVVHHTAAGHGTVGAWENCSEKVLDAVGKMLDSELFPVRTVDDFNTARWRKLIWNIGFNPLTALLNCTDKELLQADWQEEGHRYLWVQGLMEELIAIARAEGAQLTSEDARKTIEQTLTMGPVTTSMLQDRRAGRPMELDSILHTPMECARQHQIDAPRMQAVCEMMSLAQNISLREHGVL